MGLVKKALAVALIVIFLQIIRFLICANTSCAINGQFIFGLVGTNWLAIVASVVLLVLALSFIKNNLLSLLFAGAVLSNISERFIFKGVNDYISIARWPSFNLADMLIVISLCLIFQKILAGEKTKTP